MTSTSIDAQTSALRITFRESREAPSLDDFGEVFTDLNNLVFVSALLASLDDPHNRNTITHGRLISPQILISCQYATELFRVGRVSYQSPLDILIWVTGGVATLAPTAYLTSRRLLTLWTQFSEARIKNAEANLKESDAEVLMALNNRMLEGLRTTTAGSNLDRVDLNEVERKALEKPISERIDGAARVLLNTERIAIEPN